MLQPARLPRGPMGSYQLGAGWRWWRKTVYPGDDGNIFQRFWEPSVENVQEARIVFDRQFPTIIQNPPVLRVRIVERYAEINAGVMMVPYEVAHHGEVLMVWYGPPGPEWEPLGGNTCSPGEYIFDQIAEQRGRGMYGDDLRQTSTMDRDSREQRWESGMGMLEWPHEAAMPYLGQFMDQMSIEALDEALQRRYDAVGQTRLSEVYGGQLDDVLSAWQQFNRSARAAREEYADRGLLSPNEIRRREGLPPAPAPQPRVRPGGLYGDPRELDMDARPEQAVVDEIDRLVNEQMRQRMDDYSRDFTERCEHCGEAWHGLPGTGATDSYDHGLGEKGCPGAFADEEEVAAWRAKRYPTPPKDMPF